MGTERSRDSPPFKARRQLVLVAATVVVLCGAIVIVGSIWIVSRLADPVQGPTPLALARRIRAAHLGCEQPFVVRGADELTINGSKDEVDCGAGPSFIVIARFAGRRNPETLIARYLCSSGRDSTENHDFVRGDHWIVYPVSTSQTTPLGKAVGGRVRTACR